MSSTTPSEKSSLDASTAQQLERPLPVRDGRQMGNLTVVYSPDAEAPGERFQLPEDDSFLVGRGVQQSGLGLADHSMSRLHFRIAWDGRQSAFRLGDARSKNGTFVNGVRTVSAALEAGDVIRAGDTLFIYDEGNPMDSLWKRAERAAPTTLTALLLGETGSGKEVLARFLHDKSGRPGSFVPVNCATIPRDLVAAELFGHARGAFSGAVCSRPGLFVTANKGTLLLDEIGDLPLEQQPALLRVLQENVVRPVGQQHEVPVETRIIAATHIDLPAACAAGRFREDLFARLAQAIFRIPLLRERRSEILPLARQFCPRALEITPSAAEALLVWQWPFNVRELKSVIEAFAAFEEPGSLLDIEQLLAINPAMVARFVDSKCKELPAGKSQRGPSIRREDLQALLVRHEGNVSAVARELGKVRAQVYRWIKAYGLSVRESPRP
jgi:DNA-binding NtrC family response regulator